MKIENLFRPSVLTAGLMLLLAERLAAQTFKTLHSFTDGSEAGGPQADLVLSGNTLYGTTLAGGNLSFGTVFALSTDGTGFTNLHTFTGGDDGKYPGHASLVGSDNMLFGTVQDGGTFGNGTVFAINTDGGGFVTLYSFTGGAEGAHPHAGLVLLNNTLYRTAYSGGNWDSGTVFAVNTNGTDFMSLYSFTGGTDGANPWSGLTSRSNALYGTTYGGGSSGNGTVFKVNTGGTGFTTLYDFTGGSDGVGPFGHLIISGNTLYGTTGRGGSSGHGTVFKVNTDGTAFNVLYSFTAWVTNTVNNSDGSYPHAGLFLAANTLYGTAGSGGSDGAGTVFALNPDGTNFRVLHSFAYSDGSSPFGGLISGGNTLYGTTSARLPSNHGTVFSISLPGSPPQLTIIPAGGNVILWWPTNATGYSLQTATNLVSPIWTTNFPAPVVDDGQNTVTNPISGTHEFFRLKSP